MPAVRKVKARYRVVGPKKVEVWVNQASMDEATKSLVQKPTKVTKEMYHVYFPAGHSIRVEKDELVRLGFHKKPRLVDMETGETVDFGGDPYDFMNDDEAIEPEHDSKYDVTLQDQLDEESEVEQEAKATKKG